MNELKFLCKALSLFFFVGTASATCIIHEDLLKIQNIYLSNTNWVYDLQRTDIVPHGQMIFLLCHGGMHPLGFQCQHNVFNPPLETVNCSSVLKASVVNVPDTSCPTPSLTYAVGYYLKDHFMELYRNCYDKGKLALQHSIYKTYRYTKSATRPTSVHWQRDLLMSAQEVVSFKRQVSQACVSTTLGANQPNCVFDRGHLTPSSAFIFTEFKKATFRYLNAVPQYNLVNVQNWEYIEAWVTRLVKGNYDNRYRTYDVLKVCTGALGVHDLKHSNKRITRRVPIYLHNDIKIPVPKWMYKIVSHLSGDKWVMLTYNDVNQPFPRDLNQICITTACPEGLNRNGVGFTVCCKPLEFIERNIVHLTGIC
ncbi:uncharacterized protein [Drosophila takahashii]|uniref:uncharacterized protein n=1 Tax=Drosophila takahashii TaxID=29030 RepID=UPI001CF83AC4|nr:uncharacterized protein LOC108060436 [Drosophila takahashii]